MKLFKKFGILYCCVTTACGESLQ